MTPIYPPTLNGGLIGAAVPQSATSDASGTAIFTNLMPGVYLATLEGVPVTKWTNNIPTNQGALNGFDYITASVTNGSLVAYSQTAADARFVSVAGTNASLRTNGGRVYLDVTVSGGTSGTNFGQLVVSNAPTLGSNVVRLTELQAQSNAALSSIATSNAAVTNFVGGNFVKANNGVSTRLTNNNALTLQNSGYINAKYQDDETRAFYIYALGGTLRFLEDSGTDYGLQIDTNGTLYASSQVGLSGIGGSGGEYAWLKMLPSSGIGFDTIRLTNNTGTNLLIANGSLTVEGPVENLGGMKALGQNSFASSTNDGGNSATITNFSSVSTSRLLVSNNAPWLTFQMKNVGATNYIGVSNLVFMNQQLGSGLGTNLLSITVTNLVPGSVIRLRGSGSFVCDVPSAFFIAGGSTTNPISGAVAMLTMANLTRPSQFVLMGNYTNSGFETNTFSLRAGRTNGGSLFLNGDLTSPWGALSQSITFSIEEIARP